MKTLCLYGHERALEHVKYNLEGDLLFSIGQDSHANVWCALTGERLGSYHGHEGAIKAHDVSFDSETYVTASADAYYCLWDVETGKKLHKVYMKSPLSATEFNYFANQLQIMSTGRLGTVAGLHIFDIRDGTQLIYEEGETGAKAGLFISFNSLTIGSCGIWGPTSDTIITGHSQGEIASWDLRKPDKALHIVWNHKALITCLDMHQNRVMFASGSKDTYAKLYDAFDLSLKKSYYTDRPINAVALDPVKHHILVAGGQDVRDVTSTKSVQGKVETLFFHTIYEDEFSRVRSHFAPVTALAISPDGKRFASGGYDGMVKVHEFDSLYHDFSLDL